MRKNFYEILWYVREVYCADNLGINLTIVNWIIHLVKNYEQFENFETKNPKQTQSKWKKEYGK